MNQALKYRGYQIVPADMVLSPTRKPYRGWVVLRNNQECLADGFIDVQQAKQAIDNDIAEMAEAAIQ